MKLMKVFDAFGRSTPREVTDVVSLEQANDSYAGWMPGNEAGCRGITEAEATLVDKWLVENGAEEGEEVLFWICW
jgi:hypothetical protein